MTTTLGNAGPGADARSSSGPVEPRRNHTLEKGLEILSLFSIATPELTAAQIQEQLGIPTSTLYRLLRSVKVKHWIEDDGNGNYRLSLRVLELARVVYGRLQFRDIARAEMVELSRQTRETILLTALSGDRAVCIEQVEGPQAVRVSMAWGIVMPLHAGASSTIILAFLEECRRDEIIMAEPLKRYTDNTITDPGRLRRHLDHIRADGFAFSDQEVDLGVRGIAAPILDENGRIAAGFSLVAPSARLPDARVPELVGLVKASAGRIGAIIRR